MGHPFKSSISAPFVAIARADPDDQLLLNRRPKKNAALSRMRTPKGTATPIATLSPVERPEEGGDGGITGFEVTLAAEGLLV